MLDAFARMNEAHFCCVWFQRSTQFDEELDQLIDEGVAMGTRFVHVNMEAPVEHAHVANVLGKALGLENIPYEEAHWLRFLDDLRGLAFEPGGLVLLVDGAWRLFEQEQRDDLMDLIEVFQYEARHWHADDRPCHLILQVEPNPDFTRVFGRFAA